VLSSASSWFVLFLLCCFICFTGCCTYPFAGTIIICTGEKWITTMWMRDGVSAEKPWHQFDPSGIKLMDDMGYAEEDGQDDADDAAVTVAAQASAAG
jgi:hypothetical protein